MAEPFYITTPIYYVNARPHLGHAYTTIVADVANRFHSMIPADTFFLTGTDEHGDKILEAAHSEKLTPKEYVDKISQLYRDIWPKLNINYNYFIRTTDHTHIAVVEHILKKIHAAGDIYFSEYEGLYCFGCERFYTERELLDGKCPDHEKKPELIRESNYFFRMSKYQGWLIEHINNNPDFIRPERYRNEVLSFLNQPLEDLCISRPKSRLNWGIPLPFDQGYVTYVWFDALLNYISAIGYPDGDLFKKFWPNAQHIVAKDILKPHGIYWPIILKAAGIPLYKHLNVHGYWNVAQSKMSKSLGNVIDPLLMKDSYGLDSFRYFLMREMSFGLDSHFSEDALIQRINADLANDLGNLFSRILAMANKYFGGVVPKADPDVEKEFGLSLRENALEAIADFEKAMEIFAFHKALEAIWVLISRMNKYVDEKAPWVLAKETAKREQLEAVIYNLIEGLRVVSGLIYPVMPMTAAIMKKHLGLDAPSETSNTTVYTMEQIKNWKSLKPGTQLLSSVTLFPRIDAAEMALKKVAAEQTSTPDTPPAEIKPEITLETFSKIDLRVATVLSAEPIPKAKKLLKLEVDMGETRTVVAGISESYTPEEIVGKQVIIVANLKPAKLMGIMSYGMLLAAVENRKHSISTLDKKVKPGTPLK